MPALLKKTSKIGIALISLAALFLSQQICAVEDFLSAEAPHSHTGSGDHHSHSPSDRDNHSHDQNHSNDSGDTCCKNAPSLILTQSTTVHPEKVLGQLSVIYSWVYSQLVRDYAQQVVTRSSTDPPYLKHYQNALLSLSLAPNAPPVPA